MPSTIPNAPTLLQISTHDFINYKGVDYPVNNIVSVTDNGGGYLQAVIQISVATTNDTTLHLSTADTILSNYVPDQAGVQHAYWSQSVNA